MIQQNIRLREIGWNLRIYYNPCSNQSDIILEDLRSIGCRGQNYANAVILLESNAMNVGLIYSNKDKRETIIVIGKSSNVAEFINTLSHELNHFIEHVLETLDVNRGTEDEAYFTGELYETIYRDAVINVLPYL